MTIERVRARSAVPTRAWTAYARLTGAASRLVRRLVALGLLETTRDARGDLLVRAVADLRDGPHPATARPGCSSTTPRSASSCDLLDRIAQLEAALQRRPRLAQHARRRR